MPAVPSFGHHLILHPEGGITQVEVGSFSRWVGAWGAKLTRHAWVLENNKLDGQHSHTALEFKTKKRQDDLRKDMLKDPNLSFLKTDPRWSANPLRSLVIKAHNDIPGLVGGYFTKSNHHSVVSIVGFNEEELKAGKARRDTAIKNGEKRQCNKMKLLPLLIEIHSKFSNDDWEEYKQFEAAMQVNTCFQALIAKGYVNYIHHWTPTVRKNTIEYWKQLSSLAKV